MPNKKPDYQREIEELEFEGRDYSKWGFRYLILAVAMYGLGIVMILGNRSNAWILLILGLLTFIYGDSQMRKAARCRYEIMQILDREFKQLLTQFKRDFEAKFNADKDGK